MSRLKPFQIMHIKERKKPCLFIFEEPNSYLMIGSFKDDEAADMFVKRFNEIVDQAFWRGVRTNE